MVPKKQTKAFPADNPYVIFMMDKNHKISPATRITQGLTAEKSMGHDVFAFVPPEYRQFVEDRIDSVFETGVPEKHDIPASGADNRYIRYEVYMIPLHKLDREKILFVAAGITDRKQDEEAILHSDRILTALAESAGDFLSHKGWEGVNRALERIGTSVGASRSYIFENFRSQRGQLCTVQRFEWVASGITPQIDNPDIHNAPYSELGFSRWADIFQEEGIICANVRDLPESEQRVLASQDIVSIAVIPIFVEKNWWGFIGFDDCVDERVWHPMEIEALRTVSRLFAAVVLRNRQSEELIKREEKYRNLFEQSNDAIFIHDDQGWFLDINHRACDLLGYTRDELLKMRTLDCHTPKSLPELETVAKKLGSAGFHRFETELLRKDGKAIQVDINAKLFDKTDGLYQGIVRDISEQKLLETKLLEIADAERQRLGQELHDGLCQDLKAIEYAAAILEGRLSGSAPELMKQAQKISVDINTAVSSAYSIAKGLLPVGLDAEGLGQSVNNMAATVEKLYDVKIKAPQNGFKFVKTETHSHHFFRIIQEAVLNAVTHGKATRIDINVTNSGDQFDLCILDNGSGFDPENVDSKGIGIRIMRFRANQLSATFSISSPCKGDRGTMVRCWRGKSS